MPLAPQTADVPLQTLDQISPKTSGPIGRIRSLIDAEITRYDPGQGAPQATRISKREAFVSLSESVRSTLDGSVTMGALLNNQTLLAAFGKQLLLIANDTPLVLSQSTDAWESHGYQLPTDTLTQDFVHTSNSLATATDMASIDGVCCYTWVTEADFNSGGGTPSELAGCYFTIEDANGVTLRAPTRFSANATRIKVVADGAYFWIFGDLGTGSGSFTVQLVDINGATLQTFSFAAFYTPPAYWDVTFTSGVGVVMAAPNTFSSYVEMSLFAYDAGTNAISRTTSHLIITGLARSAFLTNDTSDGNVYLATSTHNGTNDNAISLFRISAALALVTTYTVATNQPDEVANITGYIVPGGGGDCVVSFSIIDDTAAPNTNYLKNVVRTWYQPNSGSSTFVADLKSMNLASRAFALRGHYYFIGYYPSHVAVLAAGAQLPNQPTFFLCPMNNPSQAVCGRFDNGLAYADWQSSGSVYNFALASVLEAFPLGMRTALSYRAESFTSTAQQIGGDGGGRFTVLATTVGVKSWTFGTAYCAPVTYGSTMLLPGPQGTAWSGGDFSEAGINLGFEQVTYQLNSTTGTPPALTPGTYQYIVVPEWTDKNGDRVRGVPSPATTVVVSSGQYVTISGFMMHATNKKDLLIAVYRTDMVSDTGGSFITTTLHYKITVDAPTSTDSPLYNDPAQSTWSFDDSVSNITGNEILYTDKGQLSSYPPPPFPCGAVWQDRVAVIGPDNAVWFSAEKTEGDGLWFHPAFRMTLPSADTMTSLQTMDGYLMVFCEGSIWYAPPTTLPDAAGANGSIPSLQRLPFTQGCSGPSWVAREGTYYAPPEGQLRLVTRSLTDEWVSRTVVDALDGPIMAMTMDDKQRLVCLVAGEFVVLDTRAKVFVPWSSPTPGAGQLLTTYLGRPCYGDDVRAWQQFPDTYVDYFTALNEPAPYNMQAVINFMNFGGVRNYKRMWAYQLIGDVFSECTVTVDMAYNDNAAALEIKSFDTGAPGVLQRECKPARQLCSSIELTVTESVTGSQVSGQGFSLEMVSFSLGIQPKGLNRIPIAERF